jgi:uncharacterized membrane protein
VLGDGRSFDQDPRFGLIVLGEVAQRALSPAVNDPGTAIAAMNTMTRVLVDTRAEEDNDDTHDRLTLVPLDEADFIVQAFDPIARDGAALIEVQLRLQKLLSVIARHSPAFVAGAARRQAQLGMQRAELGLTREHDRALLRELHAALHRD